MRDVILSKGEDYWNIDSGSGAIDLYDSTAHLYLHLIFKTGIGFHIIHGCDPGEGPRFVAVGGADFESKVTVYVGGDPAFIPLALFISRELAWSVVQEFLISGSRTNVVEWKRTSEVRW
jgi:hypothetical protein